MSESHLVSAILINLSRDSGLRESVERYAEELSQLDVPWEFIVVTTRNANDVADEVHSVLSNYPNTYKVVGLGASDESSRIIAGLESADGDIIALLPEYLQSDPAALRTMVDEVIGGTDYVASWRHRRVDSKIKSLHSYLFNWMTRRLTGTRLHDLNSGLRVLNRRVTQSVPIYGDLFRFWPVLAARQGFRVVEVKVDHLEERVRRGDYAFGVYARRLLDVLSLFFLVKFTSKPLRFFGLLGGAGLLVGLLLSVLLSVQWFMGTPMAGRPAMVLAVLLVVLGVQFISLGLLGELIIFTHGKATRSHHIEAIYERVAPSEPTEVTT